MNFATQIKQLCYLYDIRPVRSRGQNFLIASDVYKEIIEASELTKDDIVLEVGPGFGFLTRMLASHAKKVIAVELDKKLAAVLKNELDVEKIKNVVVINEDILKMTNDQLVMSNSDGHNYKIVEMRGSTANGAVGPREGYKIVANLPYNITSIFLRKFLSEVEHKPSMMVLMLQKEVAERIGAKPGQMSLLAVSVQFYAEVQIIKNVPKKNFWPQPEVDSAIIKLKIKDKKISARGGSASGGKNEKLAERRSGRASVQGEAGRKNIINENKFFKMVKAGFKAKRKQLAGNLAKELGQDKEEMKEIFKKCQLVEKVRAQELSLDDWHKLFIVLNRQKMV